MATRLKQRNVSNQTTFKLRIESDINGTITCTKATVRAHEVVSYWNKSLRNRLKSSNL